MSFMFCKIEMQIKKVIVIFVLSIIGIDVLDSAYTRCSIRLNVKVYKIICKMW